jgi:hypothetical protein
MDETVKAIEDACEAVSVRADLTDFKTSPGVVQAGADAVREAPEIAVHQLAAPPVGGLTISVTKRSERRRWRSRSCGR